MGKVRRTKTKKLHAKAIGSESSESKVPIFDTNKTENTNDRSELISKLSQNIRLEENPFSKIQISKDALKQNVIENTSFKAQEVKLPEKAVVNKESENIVNSNKSEKLNKFEKRKLRRENFLKKLHTAEMTIRESKAAKKRAAVPVIGDINPMKQALMDLEVLPAAANEQTKSKKKRKKKRLPKRLRNKQPEVNSNITTKNMRKTFSKKIQKHKVDEVLKFQALIKSSSYKQNASETITNMIKDNIAKLS